MSRGDFGSYAPVSSGGRDGDAEYMRLCNNISTNIQQLSRNVTQIQKTVDSVGTDEDAIRIPEKIQRTIKDSQKLAKEISSYLRQLSFMEGESPQEKRQRRLQQDRLRENFSSTMNKLQVAMRRAAEKEKDSVSRARRGGGEQGELASGGVVEERLVSFDRGESQIQIQQQDEVNQQLLAERQRGIRELESDIQGVNEIFKELASMVHDQGDKIDSVEKHVESSSVHVSKGTLELEKAKIYKKKSRKKTICILVIVVVAVAVFAVLIWMAESN